MKKLPLADSEYLPEARARLRSFSEIVSSAVESVNRHYVEKSDAELDLSSVFAAIGLHDFAVNLCELFFISEGCDREVLEVDDLLSAITAVKHAFDSDGQDEPIVFEVLSAEISM